MAYGEPRCPNCGAGAAGVGLPVIPYARPPVRCPVCDGKGRMPADFYPVNVGESALNAQFVPCRTCSGRGIV